MIATACAEQIKAIIADKLDINSTSLSAHVDFKKDLGVDSLDMVEVIWQLERTFKISMPDEDLEKITTVGALTRYIEDRV